MNWPDNPYPFGTPVPSNDAFIDRESELNRLKKAYKSSRANLVLIEGARRIGKSSLLHQFRRSLATETVCLELDLQTLDIAHGLPVRQEDATQTILGHLLGQLREVLAPEKSISAVNNVKEFQASYDDLIGNANSSKRIVVLLDELDVLQERYPTSIEDLLEAFRIRSASRVLLVCCCGRPLGAPRTQSLANLLQPSTPIELEPFDEEITWAALDLARVYGFSRSARDLFWEVTQGHPLWVSAISHYIYAERELKADISEVDTPELQKALTPSAQWFKNAIWHAWRQVGPVQSLFGRAVADITWRDDEKRFVGVATGSQIESELRPFFSGIDADQLRRAADALIDNYILKPQGDGYALFAPFLGYWLREQKKSELRLAGEPKAATFLAHARGYKSQGDVASALAAVKKAVDWDPTNTDALLMAADLALDNGNLDLAIWRLEEAALSQPQTVSLRLTELYMQRIQAATKREESPDPWYYKLFELAPEEADSEPVVQALCTYQLKRWEGLIRAGDAQAARSVLEDLANRQLRDWRRIAAKKYSSVVQSLLQEDDGLTRAVLAVRHAFPTLTDRPIEPIHPTQSEFERELVSKFNGDATAQKKIRQHFEQYADQYPWWTITLSAIRRSLESGSAASKDWLPLKVIEKIARRAPESHRIQMVDDIVTLLPSRLGYLLNNNPAEAANAIRLLFESSPKHRESLHNVVEDALENHIVQICEASDDEVVNFFRHGARAYMLWVDSLTPGTVQAVHILEHIELLLDRMKTPRGPAPEQGREWELFIRGGENLTDWRDLLRHKALMGERVELLLRELSLPEDVEQAIRTSSLMPSQEWEHTVKDHLYSIYQNVRPLEITIPGIPAETVKFYRAHWNGEEVNLKVYRISAGASSREFLTYLWEKEKRALINLSTRISGRALTRFKFSERIPAGDEGESLVIVTEPAGETTLRDQLKQYGRARLQNPDLRRDLWQAIHSLIEGVNALHRAHYLHRSIRPENIFVQNADSKLHLKLGNFEWSLYLHSLAEQFPRDDRWVDRYTAPEVLAARFNKKDQDVGEGFSSEVYSLGLVLFELLVRQLHDAEIGRFYRPADYDLEAHRTWLHGLRSEIRNELSGNDQKNERLLLLEMLEPNVALRRADLDDLVQLTASLAWDYREIEDLLREHKPYVTTTLARGTPTSIEHFLEPLVRPGEMGETESDLVQLLQREISGARVYRNANRDQPLLIEGRRILFAATPFTHKFGKKSVEPTSVPEVPYLTVATVLDRREGFPLARLPADLPVVNLHVPHQDLTRARRPTERKGEGWRRLFDLVESGFDGLTNKAREFYTILQVTAEVEEKLWQQQVAPYTLVSKERGSERSVILIRRPDGPHGNFLAVDRMVAQQTTRGERFFELSSSDSPLAPLQPNQVWKLEKVDTAHGTVQLSRESAEWPGNAGFVRPQSLSGNRAIRQRRAETLFSLRDDEYLLRAITDVSSIQEKWPLPSLEYFDSALDHDKRQIVRNVLTTPPLYLVQGPPGTGKTTLAAEVIRQVLHQNPSARILITSQSHEPLNNLLIRVQRAFEGIETNRRPTAVRLLSSARLQSRRWSKETRKVMMDYQPAEVAKRYMHLAQIWQPSVDSGIDMDLLRTWRAWIEANSKNLPIELERKIVASSNLVYATANDRSISAVPEHREFDLLIFEEAAKAYPLEVLGPMRLSRRWLLIGDHEQLSAFNIEDFRREAREATSRLYYATGGQSSRVQQQSRGMGLVSTSSRLATDVADFFEFLFTKGVKTGSNFADRLSLQWRMHPTISRMLREIYYDFLKDGDVDSLKVKHAHRISYPPEFRRNPIVWIDVPLSTETQSRGFVEELTAEVPFSGGGFINPFEARVLHNMMSKVQAAGRGGLAGNIAFLSPYKAQVDLINKFFKSWDRKRNPQTGDLRQKAFTVDSFQGRQEEVVVVSLVRNNREADGFDAYGFLEGEVGKARAAVMFSRAERLLIIIGCSKHFTKQFGFHIGRVFDYVEKHGVVIEAKNFLAAKDYEYLREHRDFDKQRQAERS